MATLTVQIVSGLGTSTKTLTFSAADATRVLNAYQTQVQPNGTQDQLAAFLASQIEKQINQFVIANETNVVAPPVMT